MNKLKKKVGSSIIRPGGVNIQLLVIEQSDRKGQRKKSRAQCHYKPPRSNRVSLHQ